MAIPRSLILSALCSGCCGFYLPGVAPTEYDKGAKVDLKVNKLTSSRTQLPYRYYTLPFCKPAVIEAKVENLGEILTGDQIENSAYEIRMGQNKTCEVLCAPAALTEDQRNHFKRMIDNQYYANWIIDNLPASTLYLDGSGGLVYLAGFPIGFMYKGFYYVYNHVTLNLKYHTDPENYVGMRIVGFEIEPRSLKQAKRDDNNERFGVTAVSCNPADGTATENWDVDMTQPLMYTYDVYWTESPIRWASRWDSYLKMTTGSDIHWFSLLNSAMIMLLLTGMVAMILLRTLHRDIAKYNEVATEEEKAEETGWKLVHGDVFRKPKWAKLLAVSVGAGVQLFGMSISCMIFALLGVLSPANRGGLLQSMMLLFTFMGIFAGYVSARLYKIFQAEDTKSMTFMMAFLYPGFFFAVFFILNLFIWGKGSSGAVPMVTMFALLVLWFGISVPLVFLGSYYGFRTEAIELPVRTCHHPRQIKTQPWYLHPVVSALVSGILPFGAIFTELFFIMTSIWQHRFYYLFGFLALVMIVLVVTCAEISIAMTYFQLTNEDYHWWWRSFFYSGASAAYVFLYSIVYFNTKLEISGLIPMMLYFGYMIVGCLTFFLMTGAIGMLATFVFVKAIYGSIKVD